MMGLDRAAAAAADDDDDEGKKCTPITVTHRAHLPSRILSSVSRPCVEQGLGGGLSSDRPGGCSQQLLEASTCCCCCSRKDECTIFGDAGVGLLQSVVPKVIVVPAQAQSGCHARPVQLFRRGRGNNRTILL